MKWFNDLYGQLPQPRKQSVRRRASFRPQLEAFEKRLLPSAISVSFVSPALHVVQAAGAYHSGEVVVTPAPTGPLPIPYPNFA